MDRWVVESVRSIRAGEDLHGADGGTGTALMFAYGALPDPPVHPAAPLAAAVAASPGGDGVDRISSLPDQLLRHVVSRLPARDGARTAVLATRWRGLWRSVPLVFADTHLLPKCIADRSWRPDLSDSLLVTNAVSGALAAHPGPFRCVQISCCYLDLNPEKIAEWVHLLAAKGVQELAFINRPWPLDLPLPAELFRCTALTRLHIGAWKFPDTAALPAAAAYPNLKELFLSLVTMKYRDLVFLLERSPALEVLTIIASPNRVRLRLASRSLRCLQLANCNLAEIAVVDAPRLERLFLLSTPGRRGGSNKCARIKIGNAPNLQIVGSWLPGQHELEIGNTTIKVDTKVSPSTVVPSVQILGLEVQFDVRNEVRAVASFLKCFPNVKKLHVYSAKVDEPTGEVNFKFWKEALPIECVQLHIKKFVFHGLRAKRSEVMFIKFIAERAQVLEKMVIVLSPEIASSINDLKAKVLMPIGAAKWASKAIKQIHFFGPVSEGGTVGFWNFRLATDVSCEDPFDLMTADANLGRGSVPHPHRMT
ncbi:hypothetical protein ACP70R_039016 [Stipagrostis hirtigluma subsp. patula]